MVIASGVDLTHPMIAADNADNLFVSYLDNAVPSVKFVKASRGLSAGSLGDRRLVACADQRHGRPGPNLSS